jgi:hypothetical protein
MNQYGMTAPANEDWYERNVQKELPEIGRLSARFDDAAETRFKKRANPLPHLVLFSTLDTNC